MIGGPLRRHVPSACLPPRTFGPTQVWTGTHDGQAIAVALSGIGKVNAAAAATLLLSAYDAKALIFSGVAGGLTGGLMGAPGGIRQDQVRQPAAAPASAPRRAGTRRRTRSARW